jgi:ABC-type transport system involved in multi-copper enzyme maturation permease subunit
VSYNASLLFLIPALLIITLVTNEFVYKTHRQNIIDGLSRRQFISVKLFEILLLSIFSTIIVFLTGLVFGFIVNHPDPGIDPWQNFRFVGYYFVQMISYSLIALLISIFIKRAGLALGIFMLYLLIENMIVGISTNLYHTTWAYYLPEETTDRLIPQPYIKAIRTAADVANWEHHIPIYLGLAALYAAIYCVVITRRFLRSDL